MRVGARRDRLRIPGILIRPFVERGTERDAALWPEDEPPSSAVVREDRSAVDDEPRLVAKDLRRELLRLRQMQVSLGRHVCLAREDQAEDETPTVPRWILRFHDAEPEVEGA